ncbi:MAG: PD40 domain-containing protein [Chloroflexi bacterium]|nr:PD40 domain-containing protein [Chloroflexota bacterium]
MTKKRVRNGLVLGGLVVVVLLAAVIIWVYRQLTKETIKLGSSEGELVFMSDRDGDWDLYLLDKEGELHNLTAESDAHEYYPGFTFDGEQISMFSTATGDVTPARVNTDGSNFKTQSMIESIMSVLTEGNTDWDPAWDPGGDRLAWNKVLPGMPPKIDLFVSDANGENRVQITDDNALEGMHAWSPDGTELAYVSLGDNSKYNTYKINVFDKTAVRLTDHNTNDYQPFWSTDGSKILVIFSFRVAMVDGETEMSVMNADGSDLHSLGEDEVFSGDLTYSPYGGEVAYVSNETGYWHIYLMDADGSNVRQLTEGESNNLYPAWRPVPAEEVTE